MHCVLRIVSPGSRLARRWTLPADQHRHMPQSIQQRNIRCTHAQLNPSRSFCASFFCQTTCANVSCRVRNGEQIVNHQNAS